MKQNGRLTILAAAFPLLQIYNYLHSNNRKKTHINVRCCFSGNNQIEAID